MNAPIIDRQMARLAAPHGTPRPSRVPTWVQPCSVKERPDSPWQIADQHGVCMTQFGWHNGPVEARRVLLATRQKGGDA